MTERQTRSAREQGGVCGVSASPHFRAGIRESVHDPLTCIRMSRHKLRNSRQSQIHSKNARSFTNQSLVAHGFQHMEEAIHASILIDSIASNTLTLLHGRPLHPTIGWL